MTPPIVSAILASLLVVLFIAYAYFAYRYARYSRWRATWQGVILESQKVTLALLVAFFFADTLIEGWWPGRHVILITLLTALAAEAWATLIGLLYVQKTRRDILRDM